MQTKRLRGTAGRCCRHKPGRLAAPCCAACLRLRVWCSSCYQSNHSINAIVPVSGAV
jgi:hypothetical protein